MLLFSDSKRRVPRTKAWKWGVILLLDVGILAVVFLWMANRNPPPVSPDSRLQGDALEALLFAEPDTINGEGLSYTIETPEEGKTTYTVTVTRRDAKEVVSSFTFASAPAAGQPYYFQVMDPVQETFSADCSKMAATKCFVAAEERHAGWLDTEGNFFDVTETLGDGAGDETDSPPEFYALGFAGCWFGYAQRLPDSFAFLDFYVPVGLITPEAVQAATFSFVPAAADGGAPYPPWRVSDWLMGMRHKE